MEQLRTDLGPWARLLYGVVEEVLFRWGVLTLLVWVGTTLFGSPTPVLLWTLVVVSGVLFGLGHLPSYRLAGCRIIPLFLASMIAHMLYHLVWLPFDLHFFKGSAPNLVSEQEMA